MVHIFFTLFLGGCGAVFVVVLVAVILLSALVVCDLCGRRPHPVHVYVGRGGIRSILAPFLRPAVRMLGKLCRNDAGGKLLKHDIGYLGRNMNRALGPAVSAGRVFPPNILIT
jgi:hypothetical protein